MNQVVLNEKEYRDSQSKLARLDELLSSENALKPAVAGLPPEVVVQVTRLMESERRDLRAAIEAYEGAKETSDPEALQERIGREPGTTLIVARIAKGYSQRDLAWRLGVKEQQIQRYEADRYATISLKNYARIAVLLGVQLKAEIVSNPAFRGLDTVIEDVSKEQIRKILKHGRQNGWFADEIDEPELRRQIAENRIFFGSPSLLRTGLSVRDHSDDALLHAWRAQVAQRARSILKTQSIQFDPLDINWLPELTKASAGQNGPLLARDMLSEHGVLLIAEPQIPGLAIDGAAFLDGETPVIGLTLRKDTVDNFWFTLMHELGHVYLHYRTGLTAGFFDQSEAESIDQQENEADTFAQNLLIPDEQWRSSAARISRSPKVIEKFAADLGISSAIVFGRIRKEQNDYRIFSNRVGANTVRKQFFHLN